MKKIIYLFIFQFLSQCLYGQNLSVPEHLKIVNIYDIPVYNNLEETPIFFQLMMQTPLQLKKIDSAFYSFGKMEEIVRKDDAKHEDSFERLYLYWRRKIIPYLDRQNNFVNQQNSPQTLGTSGSRSPLRVSTANTWEPLGPKAVYRNTGAAQRLAPQHQNIYYIGVAASNTNIIYANTETGWTFKSTDKGLNWLGVDSLGVGTGPIAIHPTNPNIVLILKDKNLYRSSDGGISWNLVKTLTNGGERIHFNPFTPNNVYLASADGFFRSADAGITWTLGLSGSFTDVKTQISGTNIYLAAYDGKFYKSTDAGITFTNKSFVSFSGEGTLLSTTAADANTLYYATLYSGATHIYKSSDGGNTFVLKNNTSLNSGQGFYDFILIANPLNANQIIVGTQQIDKSIDGGTTLTRLGGYSGVFDIHPDAQDVLSFSNGDTFLATDGGISYSTDFFTSTNNYSTRMNGIWVNDFWGFGHSWNLDIFGGGRYHNGNVIYNGKWANYKGYSVGGAESPTGNYIEGLGGMVFQDLSNGILFTPSDNLSQGAPSSDVYFTFQPNDYYYGSRLADIKMHPTFNNIYFGAKGNSIYYTLNYGKTFKELKNFGETTWEIHIFPNNPKKALIVCQNNIYYTNNIFAWETGSWQQLNLPASGSFYAQIDESNDNKVWIANSSKLYMTTDMGITWQDIPLPNNFSIESFVKQEGKAEAIYLLGKNNSSRSMEVYYKDTSFSTFQNYSSGLVKNFPSSIKPFPFYAQNKIRFAGSGWGVWQNDFFSNTYSVIAQPTVNAYPSICVGDTLRCDSRSVVNQSNVSWNWSFSKTPSYLNASNIRNPKAVFNSAGEVTATLTVTDNNTGQSSNKSITFKVNDAQNNTPFIISTLDDTNGFNFVKAKNVVLQTNVPTSATLYIYYSDSFKSNLKIDVTGNIFVHQVKASDLCSN